MPKIDVQSVTVEAICHYPDPFWKALEGRSRRRLGNAAGLTQFGVNLTKLKPGSWSSQRHWHRKEDEFIYIVSGELVLCEDEGEIVLKAGDCAGFKANGGNGHCLINRTQRDALYIEIGTRSPDEHTTYSDIDMQLIRDASGQFGYSRKSDGVPYPKRSAG